MRPVTGLRFAPGRALLTVQACEDDSLYKAGPTLKAPYADARAKADGANDASADTQSAGADGGAAGSRDGAGSGGADAGGGGGAGTGTGGTGGKPASPDGGGADASD